MPKVAIILCAGKGERFGGKKQFFKLAGKPVCVHTIERFIKSNMFDEIVVVIRNEDKAYVKEMLHKYIFSKYNGIEKKISIVSGGESRQESSKNAVIYLLHKGYPDETKVLIHDAVRPFVSQRIIKNVVENIDTNTAVDVVVDAIDTIVRVNDEGFIVEIPERRYLKYGQTPQGFLLGHLKKMYLNASPEYLRKFTDDCGIFIETFPDKKVKIVKGEYTNIKITTMLDLYLADKVFLLSSGSIPTSVKDIENSKEQISKKLKDDVIAVIGGTSGIGSAIVNLANSLGMRAFAGSRRTGVDVRDELSIREFLEDIYAKEGKLNHVIVTAGILIKKPLMEMTDEEIKEQIETNYIGSINTIRVAVPILRRTKKKPKHIVLFSSSSYTRGRGYYSIYSSTKAAIVNLVQALSEEFDDIKINAIVPERTLTPMRIKAFGKEDPNILLKPETVAWFTLYLLTTEVSGLALEIRKHESET